jgi:hypothetical protein
MKLQAQRFKVMSKRNNRGNSKPGNNKPNSVKTGNSLFDVGKLVSIVPDTLKSVFGATSSEAIASTQANADYFKERLKQCSTPEERAAVDAHYQHSRREQQADGNWNRALGALAILAVWATIASCTYMTKEVAA